MKLTNKSVAKVLGYVKNGIAYKAKDALPNFTTSLDAIVFEIEARGLKWLHDGPYRDVGGEKVVHCVEIYAATDLEGRLEERTRTRVRGTSAPLALCAALLAFLKDSHAK